MNKQELDRLKAISGEDSYLYQLAKENASDGLKTGESDTSDPEAMQERADEFRKDDSLPSEPESV